MSKQDFDQEKFTGEIRKFLKKVGITSQIEIENAVRAAWEGGRLGATQTLEAKIVLEVPGVGLRHEISHELALR